MEKEDASSGILFVLLPGCVLIITQAKEDHRSEIFVYCIRYNFEKNFYHSFTFAGNGGFYELLFPNRG
jgi:hypothetical protein